MYNPICGYCGKVSEQCTGADIYPNRQDLFKLTFYRCQPCDSRVGCHPGTATPLGSLANVELRNARVAAHTAFDGLWIKTNLKRSACYEWLRRKMAMTATECHIGKMDVEQCKIVVNICKND